jgi:hypothetical protein
MSGSNDFPFTACKALANRKRSGGIVILPWWAWIFVGAVWAAVWALAITIDLTMLAIYGIVAGTVALVRSHKGGSSVKAREPVRTSGPRDWSPADGPGTPEAEARFERDFATGWEQKIRARIDDPATSQSARERLQAALARGYRPSFERYMEKRRSP